MVRVPNLLQKQSIFSGYRQKMKISSFVVWLVWTMFEEVVVAYFEGLSVFVKKNSVFKTFTCHSTDWEWSNLSKVGTWNIRDVAGVGEEGYSSRGYFLMDGSPSVVHNPRISAFKYAWPSDIIPPNSMLPPRPIFQRIRAYSPPQGGPQPPGTRMLSGFLFVTSYVRWNSFNN